METLMLVIDTVGVALVLYWSMKNDPKKGQAEEGWLRIADPAPEPPKKPVRGAYVPPQRVRRL